MFEKVEQRGKYIYIRGMNINLFQSDLKRKYKSSTISKIFEKTFSVILTNIKIHSFFLPEFYYLLNILPPRRQYKTISGLIEKNTWMEQVFSNYIDKQINMNLISKHMSISLKPYQKEFLDIYEEKKYKYNLNGYILAFEQGLGKFLKMDEIIYTSDGPKMNKDLTLDDKIIGSDGKFYNVTGIYPQPLRKFYKITFSDGSCIDAGDEHLWAVSTAKDRKKINRRKNYLKTNPNKKYEDIPLQVLSTKEMYANVKVKLGGLKLTNYAIPYLSAPAEFNSVDNFDIDPYFFGYFIGDGSTRNRQYRISVDREEKEILQFLEQDKNIREIRYNKKGVVDAILYKESKNLISNMGLDKKYSYEKFLPEEYKYSSVKSRIALLQGLMDSVGSPNLQKNSKKMVSGAEFTTTSLNLAEDVKELVFSLGGKAICNKYSSCYKNKDGNKRKCRDKYRIQIYFPEGSVVSPFRMTRKQNLFKYSILSKWMKYIKNIEYIGEDYGQCISVDSPDRLFVTKDFIITHNTATSLSLMTALNKSAVIIVAPKSTLHSVWESEIEKFFKENQKIWVVGSNRIPEKNTKFFIVNYESIDKLNNIISYVNNDNVGIIVDESHNFRNQNAKRVNDLQNISKAVNCGDILLMSGTPIKAMGSEMIPSLFLLDNYFDREAREIFVKVFGLSREIATDVLANRLGIMMHRKRKSEVLNLPEKTESYIKVKFAGANYYTLKQVKERVLKFISERNEYYKREKQKYVEEYYECIEFLKKEFKNDPRFQEYLKVVKELEIWGYDRYDSDLVKRVKKINEYEKTILYPTLPNEYKRKFKRSRAVVKYVNLKIMGEVIGGMLSKERSEMFSEMLKNSPICNIVGNSLKKSICFTSYVDVAKITEEFLLKKCKIDSVGVYSEKNALVHKTLNEFKKDPKIKALVATIQSLSTGVTLNEANTVIFLNPPWRDSDKQQAIDRCHRIGQDVEVYIYNFVLDTGNEPNLSTRMEDIISWSKEMFDQIVDDKNKK